MSLFYDNLAQNELGAPPAILSITQVSNLLKRQVESNFASIRVKGEISGLKIHTSGHAYFTLKDQDAVLDSVIWRGTKVSVKLEDGMAVVASGKITTYPARSKYQMIVENIEPAGVGELMQQLILNKERFQKEGLFANSRPLPKFPKIIGVITSPTGAVLQDILHRIRDRFPCHVMVWPVLVQGAGAAEQVAAAVRGFNARSEKPDVLIVARGGGSFEDLWVFNEEVVIRAVHASEIPVISAVGHETDTTLIDFASDLRAPTPTAAAELATPVLTDLIVTLSHVGQRMINGYNRVIQQYTMRYQLTLKGLIDPYKYTLEKGQRLDDWVERLERLKNMIPIAFKQRLDFVSSKLFSPRQTLQTSEERLSVLSKRLFQSTHYMQERLQQNFKNLAIRLEQSSYEKTLEKGFCMLTDENQKPITSVDAVLALNNKQVTLKLKDGLVGTRIVNPERIATL